MPARTLAWPIPRALTIATAAAQAVEFVGLPEAGLNLAQAVVHLALAPKSNRVALGWWAAQGDVRDKPLGPVPPELRDAHYRGAAALGHGVGYEYPHDDPRGFVEAVYLPEGLAGRRYYEPSRAWRRKRSCRGLEGTTERAISQESRRGKKRHKAEDKESEAE